MALLLRGVAEAHPTILVLDDLHWADAATLLLLRHVVRAAEGISAVRRAAQSRAALRAEDGAYSDPPA